MALLDGFPVKKSLPMDVVILLVCNFGRADLVLLTLEMGRQLLKE